MMEVAVLNFRQAHRLETDRRGDHFDWTAVPFRSRPPPYRWAASLVGRNLNLADRHANCWGHRWQTAVSDLRSDFRLDSHCDLGHRRKVLQPGQQPVLFDVAAFARPPDHRRTGSQRSCSHRLVRQDVARSHWCRARVLGPRHCRNAGLVASSRPTGLGWLATLSRTCRRPVEPLMGRKPWRQRAFARPSSIQRVSHHANRMNEWVRRSTWVWLAKHRRRNSRLAIVPTQMPVTTQRRKEPRPSTPREDGELPTMGGQPLQLLGASYFDAAEWTSGL